jgi:predicted  nucleic acid-binding Zn-ribbon protein
MKSLKTFNNWLLIREDDEQLVRCPWCDTEYLQNGKGCPKCGGGAYDEPKKSMTDLEHKRMANWQKELDAAEDEWQRVALKHKSNGMSWEEIYKIPEAREAYHKYTDIRQHINSSPNNEAWKMRPWDAQQQQRYDRNVEFRKNNPDLPLYPRDKNYHAWQENNNNAAQLEIENEQLKLRVKELEKKLAEAYKNLDLWATGKYYI